MSNCPSCRSLNSQKLFDIKNPRKIGPKILAYHHCLECYVTYLSPRFKVADLNKIYSKSEYFDLLSQSTKSNFVDFFLRFRLFPEYHEFVSRSFSTPGNILDVGCGAGEFIKEMTKIGWDAFGIDMSRIAISRAKQVADKDHLRVGVVSKQIFGQTKFQAISFWHVLEHVPSPREFLTDLGSNLKPAGKLFFEVPNSNSWLFRRFKADYNWLMVPEHIWYFSPDSIMRLARESGFSVQRFEYPPRALLNFSLSLYTIIRRNFGHRLAKLLFIPTIPISLVVGICASMFGYGEVFRAVLVKEKS